MEKLLLIVLVFFSWLIGFSTPSISESHILKESHSLHAKSPNSLNKSNTTRTESSLDKISELGLLLTSCPFVLQKNEMHGRIPSMFYEVECLTCKKCGKKGRCTQLVTEIEATFVSKNGDNSWTESITVKAGCTCAAVLRGSPGNIRP